MVLGVGKKSEISPKTEDFDPCRHIPTVRFKMVPLTEYHSGVVDYDIYPMRATHIPLGRRYELLSLDICHSPFPLVV